MKNFKNLLTSKTIICLLLAILATLSKTYNIDLPIEGVSPEVTTYVQYISLILAVVFRYKAKTKLTV